MKNIKLFKTALIVFVITCSALAFNTRKVGAGSVYCIKNGTTCEDKRNYRPDPLGDVADVCNGPEYIQLPNDCVEVAVPFSETPE